jgi:ATP-binding protein involved in chromosome partitioning
VNVPVLGIVENMAWFTPKELPNNKYYIFGHGGARAYAEQAGVPFLGDIPLIQSIMEGGECGTPTVATDEEVERYYRVIAEKIVAEVVK